MAEDDPAEIAAALETSPVYRAPGTEAWLSDAAAADLAATITENDLGLFVVLEVPPASTSNHGADLLTLVKQARDRAGVDSAGLYVGVDYVGPRDEDPHDPYTETAELRLAFQQWGDVSPQLSSEYGADDLEFPAELFLSYGHGGGDGTPFELAAGLQELADRLAEGDAATIRDDGSDGLNRANETNASSTSSAPGAAGEGDGPSLPLVGGVVAALVVVAVVVAASRRRGSRRTFALPDSVLSRVREAEADELRRRARSAVVVLGERIDGAKLGPRDDAETWQSALDHYEAAGRLVPDDGSEPDVLDAVGAIVLADRGEQALAATRRRKGLVFTTPCFLNPLHGTGRRQDTVTHGRFRVDAPVCDRCHADLKAGRRPDILDVVEHGRAEHYFETNREPWASTGYGALQPDLLTLIRSRG
ncbi:hypothetical protein QE364_000509 [Nocardioides zeae]|uniref:Uncharacterized protein n=2 Tax=Nocardioides zeae TaxID=1457234 RepID=A0ACC6IDH1_9ACTN|nr:hypothetical protein [Nocardioides zeae]MDQ1104416.1 hypothetical protein [Nocardioides zeae]MDR6175893.1 hypothetical protein [Nocardioides zeae]MDR6208821.1 hypothetical protein [Nocardioides zeae]